MVLRLRAPPFRAPQPLKMEKIVPAVEAHAFNMKEESFHVCESLKVADSSVLKCLTGVFVIRRWFLFLSST